MLDLKSRNRNFESVSLPAESNANHRFLSGGARIVEKLSPMVTGYVVAATRSFNTAFVAAGTLAPVGAVQPVWSASTTGGRAVVPHSAAGVRLGRILPLHL